MTKSLSVKRHRKQVGDPYLDVAVSTGGERSETPRTGLPPPERTHPAPTAARGSFPKKRERKGLAPEGGPPYEKALAGTLPE